MRRTACLAGLAALIVGVLALGAMAQPPQKEGNSGGKDKGKGKGPLEIDRASVQSGIQWFATWDSGLREAQRSGRPILMVSAAPHCAGVSGVW